MTSADAKLHEHQVRTEFYKVPFKDRPMRFFIGPLCQDERCKIILVEHQSMVMDWQEHSKTIRKYHGMKERFREKIGKAFQKGMQKNYLYVPTSGVPQGGLWVIVAQVYVPFEFLEDMGLYLPTYLTYTDPHTECQFYTFKDPLKFSIMIPKHYWINSCRRVQYKLDISPASPVVMKYFPKTEAVAFFGRWRAKQQVPIDPATGRRAIRLKKAGTLPDGVIPTVKNE
jgi:hypothetical protein